MNRTLVIVLIIVTAGVALAYWKRNWILQKIGMNKAQEFTDQSQAVIPSNNSSSGITYKECTTGPFKKGCTGKHIESIQKILNHLYNSGLAVDGYFGQATEDALVANGYGETVELEDIRKMTELIKK